MDLRDFLGQIPAGIPASKGGKEGMGLIDGDLTFLTRRDSGSSEDHIPLVIPF